jgi:hypothetical protein
MVGKTPGLRPVQLPIRIKCCGAYRTATLSGRADRELGELARQRILRGASAPQCSV